MTARLAMPPPLFSQRQWARYAPMWYWLHARACPLLYRARAAGGYRS